MSRQGRKFGALPLLAASLLVSVAWLGASFANSVSPSSPVAAVAHPDGWSDRAYYLKMPDGTRIAISLYFPGGKPPSQRVPVILIQTRYGRAGIYGHSEGGRYKDFVAAGYVVAMVDTRGSTASFGKRRVEIGPDEVADMNTIVAHLKSQPWSNGQVLATGVSYMADTADIATGARPRILGAVVREADFDAYLDLFNPGGVYNELMMREWGGETLRRDLGRSIDPSLNLDCALRVGDCAKLWPRLQQVDGDDDFNLIREAIAGRERWLPDDYKDAEFRDDLGRNGFSMFDSSSGAHLAAIRARKVPTQYWGSWMDAGTAESVLARYRSLPNVPMDVWLSGHAHGADMLTDPLLPDQHAPIPSFDDQMAGIGKFFAEVRAGKPIGRQIHYYVLGTGRYKTTKAWPPTDVTREVLRFAPSGALAASGADASDGEDAYAVDFTATMGLKTRWTTQIGEPAAYPDLRDADKKLLLYTGDAMTADTEIVGTPTVSLYVSTQSKDPAFFVYLQDVAPDGRVSYLTEGEFRAVDRKPATAASLPYAQSAPFHSFRRADAEPVIPGQVFEASFALFPVAARIRAGHRLRVAIAGADADTFRRYSDGGSDVFRVQRSARHPSAITVALRPWRD
ncbi:MAG: CocE/NonD family hydrolase [Rhizomicrobium sp.]